jgi:hypothetical protein
LHHRVPFHAPQDWRLEDLQQKDKQTPPGPAADPVPGAGFHERHHTAVPFDFLGIEGRPQIILL